MTEDLKNKEEKSVAKIEKSPSAYREEEVLRFWQEKDIFKKTLAKESPKGEFVFYEGPPTANGKPAIHHLEARAFKDVIPRYKTMQGFHVPRKAGWDTHGLPVEIATEKELGLTSKKEVEKYGIANFNKKCKESVFKYLEDWGKFTNRIGYFVDQENAYFTFNNSYIESVWNVVSVVNKKGLLYKDYKVLPWCPRCGTALSSHELAQGYETVKDLSVFVKFKVVGEEENTYLLAWTTTPWTLPGNVALAVGEGIDYVKIKKEYEILILAKERLSIVIEEYEIIGEMKGKELLGLTYEPLYPFLKDNLKDDELAKLPKAFKVYGADFVTTTDGTGIVHTAVMYGADDFALGNKVGLPKYHLVKEDGTFKEEVGFLTGKFVKDEETAVLVIKDLHARGLLFKKEKYEHSYPFCWRCKTPLIYFARDSWYIRMSELRDTLVSENKKINWEPEYIKEGRFGEWLREIKDWAISRERYWGTPLPIWETLDSRERVVVDSLPTLKRLSKKSGNKYFLMRHGEATNNIKEIFSSDEEEIHHLTDEGKESVLGSVKDLMQEKIDLIIHSPLARVKETVSIIKETLGEIECIEDVRLREEGFGTLSGTSVHEFKNHFPNFKFRLDTSVSGSETLREIKKRVGEFIYEIDSKYKDKNILIVTHDGPAKLFSVVNEGADDIRTKEIYNPGVNFLSPGSFVKFEFTSIPHDEDFKLDLHRPFIDQIELVSEKGSPMKRVKEVMDVWFDSGSMPFAQNADNKNLLEKNDSLAYPADFISEAIDQTRGWFYTLHAIGCLMGKGRAYKNVICLGHLLDKNGKKMSKSQGNVLDPFALIDTYGVDALRLWMYSVNQPGESKNFDEKTVDEINKKVFNLLINVSTFYELYRDKDLESKSDTSENKSSNVLDQWILARLNALVLSSTSNLDNYKLLEPVREIREFIDELSTWYLRRSRDRIKEGDKNAKRTLYAVLKTLSKLLAPFAPFFAEDLYQKLKTENDVESVHLEMWPKAESANEEIIKDMKEVRRVVTLGLEARQKAKIIVRQPLASLKIKNQKSKISQDLIELINDEVNVKKVAYDDSIAEEVELDTEITAELKEEGIVRELIRAMQEFRKQKDLMPNKKISLAIETNEDGKKLFVKFQDEILSKVGISETIFSNAKGETVKVGDLEFKFQLK